MARKAAKPPTNPSAEKEGEFYSAVVNAWIGSRMERDRSLLALAAAGIGLLVTLLSTVGSPTLGTTLSYATALLALVIVVVLCIVIFQKNSDYLERLAKGEKSPPRTTLDWLDRAVLFFFFAGLASAIALGITWQVYRSGGGPEMPTPDETKNVNTTDTSKKSLSGLDKLRPDTTTTESAAGQAKAPAPTKKSRQ